MVWDVNVGESVLMVWDVNVGEDWRTTEIKNENKQMGLWNK